MSSDSVRTVLVTGGAGYIGSVLVGMLLDEGYDVVVLDRFFFGPTLGHLEAHPGLRLVRADVRWTAPEIFGGVDAVLDLAALSNAPAGELDPEKTLDINYRGRGRVARLAKENGVSRYVLASSCSVYGFQDGMLDEDSSTNPLTTYARANLQAERAVLPLADPGFTVVVLRQATVYGLSPRMRFDLAINGMTLGLFKNGTIPVLRNGEQWRPMVHVRDTSRAFVKVLESDPAMSNGQIFNVGSDDQNLQILPLASQVAEAVSRTFHFAWYGTPDDRSYRVSFQKITSTLGYRTELTPSDAARDIYDALSSEAVTDGAKTRTVDWYRELLHWQDILNDVTMDGVLL